MSRVVFSLVAQRGSMCYCSDQGAMARPVTITTPFPSVAQTAKKLGVSEEVARELSNLAEHSRKTGVFVLPGIGRLVRVERKVRKGRNPATGETIRIPAKKVVKFRLAKAAKDVIAPPKKK